jgi:hypothetical protein
LKRILKNQQALKEQADSAFLCERCSDTGEYLVTSHNIINADTGEKEITWKHFCECYKGRTMAKEFNGGRKK